MQNLKSEFDIEDYFADVTIPIIDPKYRIFTPNMLEGDPPEREWVIEGYIPKKSVTGLFGPGGVGKSLLLQQMATALSTGRHWLGLPTIKTIVLSYFCEDDKDELWRRQIAINKAMGLTMPEVDSSYMQSRPGLTNLMMIYSHGVGSQTEFFRQIEQDIKNFGATVVLLDNSAQLFGGNENDRREVTQFVNALHKIVNDHNVSIVLLGHPPKTTNGLQAEYSGSTAWDACFRSRLFFGRPRNDDNEEDETSEDRILKKSKANYSSIGDTITVEWRNGVFCRKNVEVDYVEQLELNARQKDACHAFLQMLDILTDQKREVTHTNNSHKYAPKVMLDMSIARDKNLTRKMLERAMNSLINDNIIEVNSEVGVRAYKPVYGIKRRIAQPKKED